MRSGFLAAVTVNGKSKLVVNFAGQLSTDLDLQIAACCLSGGVDVQADFVECQTALDQIGEWFDRECASEMAGIADSRALRRKRFVTRIDAAVESAPPHSRANRLVTAARARNVVTAQQSAAIEEELDSLARAPLSEDEWLAAVAQLDSARRESFGALTEKRGLEIHALLVCAERTTTLHDVLGDSRRTDILG